MNKMGFHSTQRDLNPLKYISAPSKSNFEVVELSGRETVAVIRYISDPLVKVLVILVAVTGMRISEALALSGDAIDDPGLADGARGLATGNRVFEERGFAFPVIQEKSLFAGSDAGGDRLGKLDGLVPEAYMRNVVTASPTIPSTESRSYGCGISTSAWGPLRKDMTMHYPPKGTAS